MTREQIVEALRAAGLTDPDEHQIGKATAVLSASGDSDVLEKALTGLRDAFDREHSDENDRLAKAMEQSSDVVEAITAGADAVMAEQAAQNAAMAKGMSVLIDEARAQREEIRALTDALHTQGGAVERLEKAMGVPLPPRALTGASPVPAPADAADEGTSPVPDLINKAMGVQERAYKDGDTARVNAMSTAIVQLNSGHAPAVVAQRFGL